MFEITEDIDGGYVAERLTESIVTQGDTWEELRANIRANIKDAVEGFISRWRNAVGHPLASGQG